MKKWSSVRTYVIAYIEGDKPVALKATLHEILAGDWEFCYALQDRLDTLLDLRLGDSTKMQFNRDNHDSIGIIKRII